MVAGKTLKKILILLFMLFPVTNVFALDDGYVIENYNINITVNENHILNIIETIDVNFIKKSHGINREIPIRNEYIRKIDDEEIIIDAEANISNLKVNNKYEATEEYRNLSIKIGDKSKKIIGKQKYVISYDYDMGEDYIPEFDDLYFNIIGSEWDCNINNISFEIKMPNSFDESSIKFYSGYKYSDKIANVTYNVKNNVIKGKLNDSLSENQALTIYLRLPEGYYINENKLNWYNKDSIIEIYYYDNYSINAVLSDNNILHVEEKFNVILNKEYSLDTISIMRKFRKKGYTYRKVNGKLKKQIYDYEIKNLKSNLEYDENFDLSRSDLNISFYKDTSTYSENEFYTISYDIDFGDNLIEEDDTFYYSFLEDYINVKNFSFKLKLPKEISKNNYKIYKKYYDNPSSIDEYDKDEINCSYINKEISCIPKFNYKKYSIAKNDKFVLKIDLEEGYFSNERKVEISYEKKFRIFLYISFILIIISTILFFTFGYRKRKLVVVQYTPPENLSPAEVGYIYKGRAHIKHILSLIIYFAHKNYLKIIETGEDDFSFEKQKEIEDYNKNYIKTTFNGIFHSKKVVSKKKLSKSFYHTLSNALEELKGTREIYSKMHYVMLFVHLVIIIFGFILIDVINNYESEYILTKQLFLMYKENIILISILLFINVIYLINYKKSNEDELYFKIRGFRDYIKNVSKDQIKSLVEDNPSYFFDILPYAYVLGITDKWSKKFESITITPPYWYSGTIYDVSTGSFSATLFTKTLSKTLKTANSSSKAYANSHDSSSSHDSYDSGGGGSSGGGGGGGGGSRW